MRHVPRKRKKKKPKPAITALKKKVKKKKLRDSSGSFMNTTQPTTVCDMTQALPTLLGAKTTKISPFLGNLVSANGFYTSVKQHHRYEITGWEAKEGRE